MQYSNDAQRAKLEAAYRKLFYTFPPENVWTLINRLHPDGFAFHGQIEQSPYLIADLAMRDAEAELEDGDEVLEPERAPYIEIDTELPKQVRRLSRRVQAVIASVAVCIVISVVALGFSGKALEQSAPIVDAEEPAPTNAVDTPFWFKTEIHAMVTGKAEHDPDWWGRQMKKASPEELALYETYLAGQKRDSNVYWVDEAETYLADVRLIVQETAGAEPKSHTSR